MECPSETTIAGLVDGVLPPDARAEISDHLSRCDSCRELVAALAGPVTTQEARPRARTQQSIHDGRYLLERVIGEGGMGVVFRAYDAQLRRPIALKLVRPDRMRAEPTGRVRDRFLREAQAMAQLSHPNVVTVYDVGVDDDQVFVAMELVDGQTLRQWSERPRTLDEIRDVLEQAGKGLAAAHAVGLVHRDFKPDNVLVRSDGRVQVSDFGLARRYDSIDIELDAASPTNGPITGTLTATGATAGTPAYMSPEQWSGERASVASDQYSFCQVAWELLYGARPYGDTTDPTILKQRIASGAIVMPARSTIPVAIERVLRRGLEREPSARFPAMSALLSELSRALRPEPLARPRTRPALFAAMGIALATAIIAPIAYRARTTAADTSASNTNASNTNASNTTTSSTNASNTNASNTNASNTNASSPNTTASSPDTAASSPNSNTTASNTTASNTSASNTSASNTSASNTNASDTTASSPNTNAPRVNTSRPRKPAPSAADRPAKPATTTSSADRAKPATTAERVKPAIPATPPQTGDRAKAIDRSDAVMSDPWKQP